MKTITEPVFLDDVETYLDHAEAEPVEVFRDDGTSVVLVSRDLYDEMILNHAPFIR
ncbi:MULTISPECIES: hypothetical protein [Pantoea]|uniref:hypothetical protein n=1 Tax=Pantoea TaxID=53335 RepID=UPI001419BA54|nr:MULTISPECIES: hypothetical protein [Pantoea]